MSAISLVWRAPKRATKYIYTHGTYLGRTMQQQQGRSECFAWEKITHTHNVSSFFFPFWVSAIHLNRKLWEPQTIKTLFHFSSQVLGNCTLYKKWTQFLLNFRHCIVLRSYAQWVQMNFVPLLGAPQSKEIADFMKSLKLSKHSSIFPLEFFENRTLYKKWTQSY